mmetsp:Transcript_49898/g.108941  ORF Transcript_49898/g.108941 Transcript_49898/m.108941 type:complete len:98 (+) Transcript_49898:74-367(+)
MMRSTDETGAVGSFEVSDAASESQRVEEALRKYSCDEDQLDLDLHLEEGLIDEGTQALLFSKASSGTSLRRRLFAAGGFAMLVISAAAVVVYHPFLH